MNDSGPIHVLVSIVLFFQCFVFTVAIFAVNPFFAIVAVADFYCFVFHIDYAKKLKNKKPMIVAEQEPEQPAVLEDKNTEFGTYHYSFKKENKTVSKTKLGAYDQSLGNNNETERTAKADSFSGQSNQADSADVNSGAIMGADGKMYYTGTNIDDDNQKRESRSDEQQRSNAEYSKESSEFSMPDSSTINDFFGKSGVGHEKNSSVFQKEPETNSKGTRSFSNDQTSSASKTPYLGRKIEIQTKGRISYYFGLVETYRSAYDWGLLDGAEEGEEYPLYEYKKLPCQLSQDEEKYSVYVDPGDGMKYLGTIPRASESETAIENGRKWHVEVDGGSTYIGTRKSYEKVWLPLHFYLIIEE